ncbi:tRNA preQ1(34) S-adenosylmethionine ribosyltransferase-isomerase QueA [Thiotrichales bacterium 19S3-7]|nr:tRNA preQ1(34) S-adenosylmethionine ribosyltransferase-isomerase QueA [Thiotrichales bacterium 19S3-7]MCF6800741.1 tRNA preQ1(34) S-adenosylmethionine ribosyltransferase-isomerase QueA [Thiotrichales bacterium 19S3-11]
MKTDDFNYELPQELIAQYPTDKRDHSRLLVLNRNLGLANEIQDKYFYDLPSFINSGDLLVFNNSKVMSARLFAQKQTGGKVELLIERILDNQTILSHLRVSRKPKAGECIYLDEQTKFKMLGHHGGTLFKLELMPTENSQTIWQIMEQFGHMPLPPYMQRDDQKIDIERYQTVYSQPLGSVAAPTAGLHFTDELLGALTKKGVETAYITLHVGSGTFQPVKVDNISSHQMHSEVIDVSDEICQKIIETKARGNKVIAVGTTTVRSLETAALSGKIKPFVGETDIFLYPGKKFHVVDQMITNFHLPKSTLIMLVSAFASTDQIKRAYAHAILERYRFFSYGDAMLIL